MNLLGRLHDRHVFGRRVRVLSERLANLIPEHARVLDVGCGDGSISHRIQETRQDVYIEGLEVMLRQEVAIPVTEFDGHRIPFDSKSFDVVMLVDVLHHTEDPTGLLGEAQRVATGGILLKDHTRTGFLAGLTLRVMDWVGNAPHGVVLPYNYWTEGQWREAFAGMHLQVDTWISEVGLYPWPASMLFDRSLHFVARLRP